MAAYTSTQSGNFNSTATWGGGGWPNADGDTFTVASNTVVTYNVTTPLHGGMGSSVVNAGGTFIMAQNTAIRFNGASTYHFAGNGNYIQRSNTKVLLKGTTASERVWDLRPTSSITATATGGTSGANTVTVASTAGLYPGMKLSGTGIGSNARILSINGSTLNLSVNNTGTVSGTLTFGNHVEIIGSEGMPITDVNAAVGEAQFQQGFVTAVSATNFVEGDWISVHKRNATDGLGDRNDEGFIVHDKSGNNIYIREFVGPTSNIVSNTVNTITVQNAKVFRTWQKLIFGTGANRNVLGISSIDYPNNKITLSGNITGTVTNAPVFTTGPLKVKGVGNKIRKVATTVATEAVGTATQIVLASSAGFSVDDEIIVSSKWATSETSYTDERPEKKNITAIAGNTITINSALGYRALVGAFVTRTTRDVKFISDYEVTLTLSAAQSFAAGDIISQAYSRAKGVVKNPTTSSTSVLLQDMFGTFVTGTGNSPWLSKNGTLISGNVYATVASISGTQGHSGMGVGRGATNTGNLLPSMFFRDAEIKTFSNVNTTSSRLWMRGYWSSHFNADGGVEFEGVTYCKPAQGDNFNYQDNAIFFNRYWRNLTVRCCVAWNTVAGIRFNEGYDLVNTGCYNNYSARSETGGIYWEHMDNSSTFGGTSELAYNYIHRSDDRALYVLYVRAPGRGIHHNWIDVTQGRAIDFELTYTQAILYQNRFQAYFEPCWPIASNEHNLIYNEWIPANSNTDFTLDSGFQRSNQSVCFTSSIVSLEHNYEIDGVTIFIPGGMRQWDNTEQAWRCYFDDDFGAFDWGQSEVYYIPAGVSFSARASIKLDPAFNGTAPKLEIRAVMDRFRVGFNSPFAGEQPFKGYIANTTFNASSTTDYQTAEVSITARPWGRCVTVGVINQNSNASEGWWEKPIEVTYGEQVGAAFLDTGTNNFSSRLLVQDSAAKKIRFTGGRLI
jgi:hypothetical protein